MTEAVFSLEPGEQVIWQACPAPRAYVFRHWRWSLVCLPVWLGISLKLPGLWSAREAFGWYGALWLALAWGTVGHLLAARLSWRGERYLLTDRWLRVWCVWPGRRARRLSVAELETLKVIPLSGGVATVQLRSRESGEVLILRCLEGAEALLRVLAEVGKPVDSPVAS